MGRRAATTVLRYGSDRWLTPGVIVAGIFGCVALVLGVLALCVYSLERELTTVPELVDLAARLVTAVTGLATVTLQLAQRRQVSRVERNTGKPTAAPVDEAESDQV